MCKTLLRPNANTRFGEHAKQRHHFCLLLTALALVGPAARADIIAFDAESGSLGSNISASTDATALGGAYIGGPTAGAEFPVSSDNVASYSVTMGAGTYDFYARLLVPSTSPDSQDSFFIGNGFGTQPLNDVSWLHVNRLSDTQNAYLDPEGVEIANGVYNWFQLSDQVNFAESVPQFTSLGGTEIFEIGTRESGLQLDAFAFVTSGQVVTSGELTSAAAVPEPSSMVLLGLGSLGLVTARRRRKQTTRHT